MSGSGIWSLTITQQITTTSDQNSFANVAFGSVNFTNTHNDITNVNAGNGIKGPGVGDSRSKLGAPGINYAGYFSGSSNFTVQYLNEPQTGPSTFKLVLNTDGDHWTLDFFKNGQQMGGEWFTPPIPAPSMLSVSASSAARIPAR